MACALALRSPSWRAVTQSTAARGRSRRPAPAAGRPSRRRREPKAPSRRGRRAPGPAGIDRNSPVTVDADQLENLQKEGLVVFTGNVVANQNSSTHYADRMEVYLDAKGDGIVRTVSTGNVRIITKDCTIGTAKRAEYYDAEQRVVLVGNARVWQEDNVVTGERITIFLAEDRERRRGRQAGAREGGLLPATVRTQPAAASKPPAGGTVRVRRGTIVEGLIAQGLRKRFRSRVVVNRVTLDIHPGEVVGPARAQRRGQDDVVLHDRRPPAAGRGADLPGGPEVTEPADVQALPARHGLSAAGVLGVPQARRSRRTSSPFWRRSTSRTPSGWRALEELLAELDLTRAGAATRPTRCRAASGGGSRSRAPSSPIPRYLLLDEPFTGIDPIAIGDIQEIVARLKERGIGVLITDHNVRETLAITDRAYILYDGRILASGTATRARQQSQGPRDLPGREVLALGGPTNHETGAAADQRVVMTPLLQQAIQLLQLSTLELRAGRAEGARGEPAARGAARRERGEPESRPPLRRQRDRRAAADAAAGAEPASAGDVHGRRRARRRPALRPDAR